MLAHKYFFLSCCEYVYEYIPFLAEQLFIGKFAPNAKERVTKSARREKMGRIFIQHMGGTRLFSCASCETVLTNRDELISTRYIHTFGLYQAIHCHCYLC